MSQRLVDTVDHEDAEHDFFALMVEEHALTLQIVENGLAPRPELLLADPLSTQLQSADLGGVSTLAGTGFTRPTFDLQNYVPGVSLFVGADPFKQVVRPLTTIEDMTIFDNVPGVYP